MSKTFFYLLVTMGVFLFVIKPLSATENTTSSKEKSENKADTKSGTGFSENVDKNGVSRGASGQQKYRIGYTN